MPATRAGRTAESSRGSTSAGDGHATDGAVLGTRYAVIEPTSGRSAGASRGGEIRIFVDADACPVKAEVYKVAARHGLHTFVVANSFMAVPRDPAIERVIVAAGPDAADDWIVERAGASDIVVTTDIPLADRSFKRGARVIAPDGRVFDEGSIGMALATRNLMDELRSTGAVTSGPKPFAPADRSRFLSALDLAVVRLKRAGFGA